MDPITTPTQSSAVMSGLWPSRPSCKAAGGSRDNCGCLFGQIGSQNSEDRAKANAIWLQVAFSRSVASRLPAEPSGKSLHEELS